MPQQELPRFEYKSASAMIGIAIGIGDTDVGAIANFETVVMDTTERLRKLDLSIVDGLLIAKPI